MKDYLQVLQELPLQLTSYMKSKGIAPKNIEGSNGYSGQMMMPNSARVSSASRHHTPVRGQYSGRFLYSTKSTVIHDHRTLACLVKEIFALSSYALTVPLNNSN